MKGFYMVCLTCRDCNSREFKMLTENCQNQIESYGVYKAMNNTQTSYLNNEVSVSLLINKYSLLQNIRIAKMYKNA